MSGRDGEELEGFEPARVEVEVDPDQAPASPAVQTEPPSPTGPGKAPITESESTR